MFLTDNVRKNIYEARNFIFRPAKEGAVFVVLVKYFRLLHYEDQQFW